MVLLAEDVSRPLACPTSVSNETEQDLPSSFLKVGRAQVTHLALDCHIINAENWPPKKVQRVSMCVCYIQCADFTWINSISPQVCHSSKDKKE